MSKWFEGGLSKRLEGRDEPIVDKDLPIIDAHHHLYDRRNLRYLFDEFLEDARAGHNVVGSVYIETQAMARARGPQHLRPIGEIEFANGVGAMSSSGLYGPCRACAAIVGYAEISAGDRVAEFLDRAIATAPDRFRGVRQMTFAHSSEELNRQLPLHPPGLIASDGFRRGFRHIAARGLTFDASVFHHQIPEVSELAAAFPDTTIVLNHMGMAVGIGLDPEGRARLFLEWRQLLTELARRPNVVCKVGGLGVPLWGFGFERRPDPIGYLDLAAAWRPYVQSAVEIFGVARCLMESDFPSDGMTCGYVPLWNALKHSVAGCTPAEKALLFHDVAVRVYRIDTREM